MKLLNDPWTDDQRRRFMRPNAHLYWRPDAARFLPPHQHHLLPPQLRPSPQDGYDRARPNIATWTGRRGRWAPERAARKRAEQERLEALARREATAERLTLCELKSAVAKLCSDLAFERFRRAFFRWLDAKLRDRKANFNPAQPRVPAGNPDGGQWTLVGGWISDSRVLSDETPDPVRPGAQFAATGHHST